MSNCKYVLYGSIRLMKNFMYIFHDYDIVLLVPNKQAGLLPENYKGVKKGRIDEIIESGAEKIVLCQKPSAKRDEEQRFLLNKVNLPVIPCEEFFSVYEESVKIPVNHNLYIWGTGRMSKYLLASGKIPQEIFAYIDSYKKEQVYEGKPVLNPNAIKKEDWDKAFVIIAANDNSSIIKELNKHGLIYGKDFVDYNKVINNPAEMLRQTFFSCDGYDFACDTMLNHLEVLLGGFTRVCCTTFVSRSQTNILEPDFMEYWCGKKDIFHRILALSTQNRSYTFCDKTMCPLFDGRKNLGADDPEILQAEYHEIKQKPEVLALGFDKSCNLACETCRKNKEIAKGDDSSLVDSIADKVTNEILPYAKFIIMAGNGEVFFSPAYRRVWSKPLLGEAKYFRLLTNGTLFNETNWEKFIQGKEDLKIILTVSIDAATKESYEKIRRLGNFSQLEHNMDFAGRLRREGKLAYFRMNFVVQKKNLHEMERFAEWGKKIGADKVFFTKILNWGTYSNEEFTDNISVMEMDGVTPVPKLKKVLESQVMKDDIVDLGTIRYSHQPNNDDSIYNYYMWELEKDVQDLFGENVGN